MADILKIRNKLADHINERLVNEKMDMNHENNAVLFEILQDLNDIISNEPECTDYGVL
jgi:hypothetical protein